MSKIICLVGPSASGKTTIAENLVSRGGYTAPRSTTSRVRRKGESGDAYHFVDKDTFEEMIERDEFVEYTEYAGNYYGLTRAEVREQLQTGKKLVIPIDRFGAEAMKKAFPNETLILFVYRKFDDVVAAIKERHLNPEDEARRIKSLDEEYNYFTKADWVVFNVGSINSAANAVECFAGYGPCTRYG